MCMNRIAGAGVGGGELGEMKSFLSFAFLPLKGSSCEVSYSPNYEGKSFRGLGGVK